MAEQPSGEQQKENAVDGDPPKEDDSWTPLVRKRTLRKKKPWSVETDVTKGTNE